MFFVCVGNRVTGWRLKERERETEGRRAGTKKGQSREVKGKSTLVVRCCYALCCCFAGYTKQRRAKRNATHGLLDEFLSSRQVLRPHVGVKGTHKDLSRNGGTGMIGKYFAGAERESTVRQFPEESRPGVFPVQCTHTNGAADGEGTRYEDVIEPLRDENRRRDGRMTTVLQCK